MYAGTNRARKLLRVQGERHISGQTPTHPSIHAREPGRADVPSSTADLNAYNPSARERVADKMEEKRSAHGSVYTYTGVRRGNRVISYSKADVGLEAVDRELVMTSSSLE